MDGLIFPADFTVVDMKGETKSSLILGRPLLATGKTLIDVESGELMLLFNNEKIIFNVCEWTQFFIQ